MVAASTHLGLPGPPRAVTVDELASVSASEAEAELASSTSNEGLSRISSGPGEAPPGSGELEHGSQIELPI